MDRTKFFKQIIENISLANDFYSINTVKPKVLDNQNGTLNAKLRELVSSVTYMRDYLVANKKDYINIYNSILSLTSTMTDDERDQIDRDVQDFVKLCNDVIKILRVEIKSRISKQQFEHENNAINLVEAYIKAIHEFHKRQKALRLKRNLNLQNFFRLSRLIKKTEENSISGQKTAKKNNISLKPLSTIENDDKEQTAKSSNTKSFLEDYVEENVQSVFGLSPEEQKIFKREGNQIYDQMNSMNEEVKDITKKLIEISKLQEIFFENILKQDSDLNQLNRSTIMSTEYIREGNEQLREAMRKNAGFRVWILFFITTLAFVVLFLDWYNP